MSLLGPPLNLLKIFLYLIIKLVYIYIFQEVCTTKVLAASSMPLSSPLAGEVDSNTVFAPGFSDPMPGIPGDLLDTLFAEHGRWR